MSTQFEKNAFKISNFFLFVRIIHFITVCNFILHTEVKLFFANTIEMRQKVAPETKAGIMQKIIKNMPRTKINLKVPSSKKTF